MGWLADLVEEWRARRRGHKYASHEIRRAARDIIGPTGSQFSPGWKQLETKGDAYMRSFDPKIPPSVFVSPSDLQRRNHPVPLVERCIEDWAPKGTISVPDDLSGLETSDLDLPEVDLPDVDETG